MIITQTPLRISLFGGGSDFSDFYLKEGGAVLNFGIDKYVYVIAKERFDEKIYINYSKKEIVNTIDEIKHELVREAMRKTGITKSVEITNLADVPTEGTGLGSSSSFTVGLLNAFYTYQGEQVTHARLAKEACEIEIDILGKPVGMQDQHIAAYGGMCFFEFKKDGNITIEKLTIDADKKRRLFSSLLVFFTNRKRNCEEVLTEQKKNIPNRLTELRKIRDIAYDAKKYILSGKIEEIGYLLRQSWEEKKKLASNVSTVEIDNIYEKALKAGALGGKILGAGAGGFLLLYCPLEKQGMIREALKGYRELPFRLSRMGSRAIFNITDYDVK